MMKNNILFTALACVALLFTSCDDEFESGNTPAVEKFFDQEVSFGGSASYNLADKQKAATRTIYGGYKAGATAEPVYWLSTDQVRLFCNESSIKSADYKVTVAENEKTETNTGLDKITDAGLRWGNPESQHTFYGVYPIPADNSLKEGATLTGTIPAVQDYDTHTVTDGNYVFAPDMDYAYMVAKTYVKTPNDIGENVYLKFAPIATAVEIELYNDATDNSYNFREIHLSSETHYLSGSFTANLDNMTLGEGDKVKYATGCPTGITYGDDKSKQVAVRLYVNGNAVTLEAGKTLKFTVFMLPSTSGADDTDAISGDNELKVTLVTSEGNKTGTLSGIKIKKSKKTYMHQMPIGGEMTYNQSEWLKYVDDDKKLNELSIPGAGGAASGVNSDGSTDAIGLTSALWSSKSDYYEQSLSIEQLWNVGIRCFEFTVDYDQRTTGTPDLGSVEVYCNAQETDMTLDQCVSEVKRLLGEHPEEFAMIIITYQQQTGWNERNQTTGLVSQTRKPTEFMSQLNNYWSGLEMPTGTQKALYDGEFTVETARGSLFCIARPTSNGEDNYAVVNDGLTAAGELTKTAYPTSIATPVVTDTTILVIHGWGALKDKWYARGFTDCVYLRGIGNDAFRKATSNLANTNDALGYNTINSKRPGRPFDVSSCAKDKFTTLPATNGGYALSTDSLTLDVNFYYSTLHAKSNGLQTQKAWVQEWARVAKDTEIFTLEDESFHISSSTHGDDGVYIKWISSLQEKKNHIRDCLYYAIYKEIEGTSVKDKNIVFINSLCGYYIDADATNPESAYPNSLTDCNAAYYNDITDWLKEKLKFNKLTSASKTAGMCGDIASFATEINAYFLTELNSKLSDAGRLAGSTGIVLMDRVTNVETDAGAKIPSIIIANNFAPDQNAAGLSVPMSDLEDGDTKLSNGYRGVVWGEWEK